MRGSGLSRTLSLDRFTAMLATRLIVADPGSFLQGPVSHLMGLLADGRSDEILARMMENHAAPRSPELMSRHDTALLVIDVQTKLLHAMSPPPRWCGTLVA